MPWKIKRENGTFRGFERTELTPEQKASNAKWDKAQKPGPLHGLQIDVKSRPRRNGTFQAGTAKFSTTNSRARDAANKPKNARSTEGERYAASLEKKSVTPAAKAKKNIQAAAERRGAEKLRTIDRNDRKRAGDYKGKYWGPDQFKGNQRMIDAWKKAGKPDRDEFAKNYKG